LRLRARFDRKEGIRERGREAEKETIEKQRDRADIKEEINFSLCDLHAMNFQFDRTSFDASH